MSSGQRTQLKAINLEERTANEAALIDLNNIKCINKDQACYFSAYNYHVSEVRDSDNPNVVKNFLLDCLPENFLNSNDVAYSIESSRNNESYNYLNAQNILVMNFKGNRGCFSSLREENEIPTTNRTDLTMTKIEFNNNFPGPCGS